MNRSVLALSRNPARGLPRFSLGYGWVVVVVASLAMTATLPGRTHGLGLITESLLGDLGIARTRLARINFATCLLGTVFCLPVGHLLDRFGLRRVLTGVVLALAVSVLGMSAVTGPVTLAIALFFVRGLGQSALSVVSMAAIGKWFRARLGMAMGVFAILLTFGFIGSVLWIGHAVQAYGWRDAWLQLGLALLLGMAPVSWFFMRSAPANVDAADGTDAAEPAASPSVDFTLGQTVRTGAFWAFAVGAAAFNLVWSAITFFNESILAEHGFDANAAVTVMAILVGTGLVSNLVGGALASRKRIGLLLGLGLAILAMALAYFPSVRTTRQLCLYAGALGITGGLITVVFFAAWGHVFGRSHLGRIQGMAQSISVVASAAGPDLLAELRALTGSYSAGFYPLAALAAVLATWAVLVRLPVHAIAAQLPLAASPSASAATVEI